MNWLKYHVASGQAFFAGAALIIAAILLARTDRPLAKRLARILLPAGLVEVVISSTAIPYWVYAMAAVGTLISVLRFGAKKPTWLTTFSGILVWCVAIAFEVPYHLLPHMQPTSTRSLSIIGDSVTAGMGKNDPLDRWPDILARLHSLEIQDLSFSGARTATALNHLQTHPISSPVVILEIGGNDLLGTTSNSQFFHDLDALLKEVCATSRQVVMLELPLPPINFEYGRIQRALAAKYGVYLIPKHVFMFVLSTEGATVDGIHLTQKGQNMMAERLWRVLKAAYPSSELRAVHESEMAEDLNS